MLGFESHFDANLAVEKSTEENDAIFHIFLSEFTELLPIFTKNTASMQIPVLFFINSKA